MTSLPTNSRVPRRRRQNAYACADRKIIECSHDVVDVWTDNWLRAPRNGIKLILGKPTLAIISGTAMNRNATEVVFGGPRKTYSFPSTIITIRRNAFNTIGNK